MNINGNGAGKKRRCGKMGKRKKIDVLNAEEWMDFSAKRSTGHEKEYK